MSGFFAPDSAPMRFLTRIADLMILNVVFIATSIPIVTLGASLTALNFTAMRLGTGRSESTTGDYFRSFRQNFRQATVLGLLFLLLVGVLAAWYTVVTNLAIDGLLGLALLALWYIVAFAFGVNLIFVFPYLAHFEGSLRDVLRNSRLMSWRHPLTAVVAFVVIALSIVVTVFYPAVTGYGILWLAIGFAAVAFVTGILFMRVFDKYAPQPAGDRD